MQRMIITFLPLFSVQNRTRITGRITRTQFLEHWMNADLIIYVEI